MSEQNTGLKFYRFGPITDGSSAMKNLLGGKGANLAEMASLGVNVPPGFTMPCELSVNFKGYTGDEKDMFLAAMNTEIEKHLLELKEIFGYFPLLSVRSGARVSMPGMMDTILNVGITATSLPFWKTTIGERAALDSYRRLIQMYSSVALGVPMVHFDDQLMKIKIEAGVKVDSELDVATLERLIGRYFKVLEAHNVTFPATLREQVVGATVAVFHSWDNPRAIEYRTINGYPHDWGTAVTIQSMVFGNKNDQSATGVVFTRDPSNGSNKVTGEFLINAQGEDVVAGIRTPIPLDKMHGPDKVAPGWGEVHHDLMVILKKLEAHYKDMQDVEFTVQDGKLFILQTRNAKRSPKAAFQVARDLAVEGIITHKEAVGRVTQSQLFYELQDQIDPAFKKKPDLIGIAAGGSLVTGIAVFTSDKAVEKAAEGHSCILVTKETDPDDIAGMNASVGILTATGGLTSHAAVVARGMNKSCVVGATALVFSEKPINGKVVAAVSPDGVAFTEGDTITLDGATGYVWVNQKVPVIAGGKSKAVYDILCWAAQEHVSISERIQIAHDSDQTYINNAIASAIGESIYIDTALLEGPRRMVVSELNTLMVWIGEALCGYKGAEIVVDLKGLNEYYSPPDRMFDLIFSSSGAWDTMCYQNKAHNVANWPKNILSKVVVKLPDLAPVKARAILTAAGIKTMGKINTVADLLACTGPVDVTEDIIQSVFGGASAFKQIQALIAEKSGVVQGGAMPVPLYWYDLLNKAAT
jgi:pyruvate,orthophosphate dikinase